MPTPRLAQARAGAVELTERRTQARIQRAEANIRAGQGFDDEGLDQDLRDRFTLLQKKLARKGQMRIGTPSAPLSFKNLRKVSDTKRRAILRALTRGL